MLSTSALKINVFGSLLEWIEYHPDELDALVFDIDGVWVIDNRLVPGSVKLLEGLRDRQILFSLLTNDANHSTMEKSQSLRKCGLEISPEEIVSCGDGLQELVTKHLLDGQLFFIMGDLGKPCFGEKAGLSITRKLENLSPCKGVLIGEDNYDWETVINGVINYFIEFPKRPLIVPNPDEFYPKHSGRIHIAAGGIGRFIQRVLSAYGVSLEPLYLGKPHAPIFEHNHSQLEKRYGKPIDPRRVLMIGDHLESDILGANNFGYRSALLLSGLTKRNHVERSRIKPELLFGAL
jgi:HAD superfamily hydrolase (TIGR01450 family)